MNHTYLLPTSCSLLLSLGIMGCGASQAHVDPTHVTAIKLNVLPTTEPIGTPAAAVPQEATFCPGSPIRVEVRATLKDGSQCSSADTSTACMGSKANLIDPTQVRLQGSVGSPARAGQEPLWMPPRDALVTAATGLSLRAWLESPGQTGAVQKSAEGRIELRPVYDCLQDNVFTIPPPKGYGASGGPGPDIKVSATLISTPFYKEAMLVRVDTKAGKTYILATDRTKPVTILSKGQNGAEGMHGRTGQNGPDGAPASSFGSTCEPGRNGMNGLDGTPGSNGGNGGIGGRVELFIDEAVGDKLQGWLKVGSIGGDGGRGGSGGAGGLGGQGSPHSDTHNGLGENCSAADGQPGKTGMRAPDGEPGRPGPPGPPVTVATAPKQALFGDELPALQHLVTAVASNAKP